MSPIWMNLSLISRERASMSITGCVSHSATRQNNVFPHFEGDVTVSVRDVSVSREQTNNKAACASSSIVFDVQLEQCGSYHTHTHTHTSINTEQNYRQYSTCTTSKWSFPLLFQLQSWIKPFIRTDAPSPEPRRVTVHCVTVALCQQVRIWFYYSI